MTSLSTSPSLYYYTKMVCHTVQSSQPSCDFFNVRNAGSWLDRCKSLRMNRISFDCRGELQHVKVIGSGLLKHFDVLLMLPNMPITGSDMQALCENHEETGQDCSWAHLRWMAFKNANFRIRRITSVELKCSSSSACENWLIGQGQ